MLDAADVKNQLDLTKLVWDRWRRGYDIWCYVLSRRFCYYNQNRQHHPDRNIECRRKNKIESTAGFAADGIGDTNKADNLDIGVGFGVDTAGNPSVTDAGELSPISYTDITKPFITSFTSTTLPGAYKAGSLIDITATTSEMVLGGSSITVTFDNGGSAVLTASKNGTA